MDHLLPKTLQSALWFLSDNSVPKIEYRSDATRRSTGRQLAMIQILHIIVLLRVFVAPTRAPRFNTEALVRGVSRLHCREVLTDAGFARS
jgi:hypothetical protein